MDCFASCLSRLLDSDVDALSSCRHKGALSSLLIGKRPDAALLLRPSGAEQRSTNCFLAPRVTAHAATLALVSVRSARRWSAEASFSMSLAKEVVQSGPKCRNCSQLLDVCPCRRNSGAKNICGQFKVKCNCQPSSECQANLVFRFRRRSSPQNEQQDFDDRFSRSHRNDKSGPPVPPARCNQ